MQKLKINDIKLKKDTELIREAILENFMTINHFAEFIERKPNTIKVYLRGGEGFYSESFKIKLFLALGKSFDEIAIDENTQIKMFIRQITENMKLYNNDDDILIFEKLKKYCIERKLRKEIIELIRIEGMHYFYKNDWQKAKNYLKSASNAALKLRDAEAIVSHHSDVAMIHIQEKEFLKADSILKKVESFLKKCTNKRILYRYYFFKGQISNNTQEYTEARTFFQLSAENAPHKEGEGRAIMNIGITYMLDGIYDESIFYYRKSLNIYSSRERKASIYNNIADAHRRQKKFKEALENIEISLQYTSTENTSDYFTHQKTYCEILIDIGKIGDALLTLYRLIDSYGHQFVIKRYYLNALKTLVDLCIQHQNIGIMELTKDKIVDIIKLVGCNTQQHSELLQFLGEIMLYKEKKRKGE